MRERETTRGDGAGDGVGSTSSGRFGRTGAFRIYDEYSLLRNDLVPFHCITEHENTPQVRHGSIPFQLILKPNTPLKNLDHIRTRPKNSVMLLPITVDCHIHILIYFPYFILPFWRVPAATYFIKFQRKQNTNKHLFPQTPKKILKTEVHFYASTRCPLFV